MHIAQLLKIIQNFDFILRDGCSNYYISTYVNLSVRVYLKLCYFCLTLPFNPFLVHYLIFDVKEIEYIQNVPENLIFNFVNKEQP